jgi:hypothetical protein
VKLNEAIYNWLQIKVVAEARPDDQAAQDTYSFFSQILEEDHQVEILDVVLDDTMYVVTFNQDGKKNMLRFERSMVEYLLDAIRSEPKYNQ